ncbi:aminopeptidase N [bacterium A37T11]|nr:aminopeptidase N [bacterium A37T11]
MKKSAFFKSILAFMTLFSCHNATQTSNLLTEGISSELAAFRREQLSDIHYELSFHIPENKEDSIAAQLGLNVNIAKTGEPLYLDFREKPSFLHSLEVNGKTVAIDFRQEHLVIPEAALQKGRNHIHIGFRAGEQSLNRNEDYLYTLLVPDRARTLFPCFDQPDLKATYQLTLTAPKEWQVLAGGEVTAQFTEGNLATHHFAQTKLIPTYLFSFVAGKFTTATSRDTAGFPMKLLYRETNTEKISQSIPTIFKQHRQAIQFLKDYTDSPFPFPKLGYAAIPNFQYGGMEHVGAIQYQEATLFLDNTATESQQLSRAKLIAHETAHMWFGDKVTMEWFNDVWMKEVFANFMADKIVNPAFPGVNHDLLFVLNHYPSAYSEDRSKGSNPIRQQLNNLNNAGSLYGSIIYDKAPIMMRQLELTVGKEPFRKGIQAYLNKYAYGNATWNDLMTILDAQTQVNLKPWSEVWVNQPSRPLISDAISYEHNRIRTFNIFQKAEDGSKKIWPQQFSIGLIYPDSVHRIVVKLEGSTLSLAKAIGLSKPLSVIYNYDGLGYGVFPMKSTDLTALPEITDDVARGYAYINSFESVLNGNIAPLPALVAYQKSLQTEKNELIIRQTCSYANTVFWNLLSQHQRDSIQPQLSKQLYQSLQTNLPANIKKTLFSLFCELAYTGTEREQLYLIWNKKISFKGLKLNDDDYTAIAMQLAIYRHPKANQILKEAQAVLSNPDKQRRFAFLLPSLSNNKTVRDQFFNGLEQEKNREHEAWVLAALNNIFHPLRRDDATKHLQQSLDWLGDIQKTGDIFFPKAWLNATVGKFNSQAAYQTVTQFLKAHPDYNPALKNKILQAADYLYRGQQLHLLQ